MVNASQKRHEKQAGAGKMTQWVQAVALQA